MMCEGIDTIKPNLAGFSYQIKAGHFSEVRCFGGISQEVLENTEPYRIASWGHTFRQRAQLKQSAPNSLSNTLPLAAWVGQAWMHSPQFVHFSWLIFTLVKLNRSAIHETKPKGQIR